MEIEPKRNAWDEAKFRDALERAGRIIECSWGVASIRDRKTGAMQTVLVFNDDSKNEFAFAFAIPDPDQVAYLCGDLIGSMTRIQKGEFDKLPDADKR